MMMMGTGAARAPRESSAGEESGHHGREAGKAAAEEEDELLAPEPEEAQLTREARSPEMPGESEIR